MAGTIQYLYDPGQEVYVIQNCEDVIAINTGRVITVTAALNESSETGVPVLSCLIEITSPQKTRSFNEVNVFEDLSSALIEYESRLSA